MNQNNVKSISSSFNNQTLMFLFSHFGNVNCDLQNFKDKIVKIRFEHFAGEVASERAILKVQRSILDGSVS